MKLLFDLNKANPKDIDENTWFYVSRSGRTIELIKDTVKNGFVKIKIPVRLLDECLKEQVKR